jgi:hypothetical protein
MIEYVIICIRASEKNGYTHNEPELNSYFLLNRYEIHLNNTIVTNKLKKN